MLNKFLVFFLLVWSNVAFSLISGEAFYGLRQYQIENSSLRSNEILLGINFDPIPLIPVSIGVGYMRGTLDAKKISADSAKVNEWTLNAKAWLALSSNLTLQGRLRYIVDSRLQIENELDGYTAKKHGFYVGGGVSYKLIPLLSLAVEIDRSFEKVSYIDNNNDASKWSSWGLLLGLQIGL